MTRQRARASPTSQIRLGLRPNCAVSSGTKLRDKMTFSAKCVNNVPSRPPAFSTPHFPPQSLQSGSPPLYPACWCTQVEDADGFEVQAIDMNELQVLITMLVKRDGLKLGQ